MEQNSGPLSSRIARRTGFLSGHLLHVMAILLRGRPYLGSYRVSMARVISLRESSAAVLHFVSDLPPCRVPPLSNAVTTFPVYTRWIASHDTH